MHKLFNQHTHQLLKDLVDADVPRHLAAFCVFLKRLLQYDDVPKLVVSSSLEKLREYDKVLSLPDASLIELDQACCSTSFTMHDYGMLIACYGEVECTGKPMYDRNVFVDTFEKSDFYDAAVLSGVVEDVLNVLLKHASSWRSTWYRHALAVVKSKKDFMMLEKMHCLN